MILFYLVTNPNKNFTHIINPNELLIQQKQYTNWAMKLNFEYFYHKYFLWSITHEFKIVMLEAGHKYNLYDIAIEFKIAMLAIDHKFHIQFLFYH